MEIEAAADARGVLLGLRARIWSDAGSQHIYPPTASLEPMGTATILPGPYRTPAYAYDVLAVATNKPPLGAYRGVGMTMGVFVMERRSISARTGSASIPLSPPAEPDLARRLPFSSAAGFVYDSGDYPTALAMALDLAGDQRLLRERDAARRHGPAPRRGPRMLHGVHGDGR